MLWGWKNHTNTNDARGTCLHNWGEQKIFPDQAEENISVQNYLVSQSMLSLQCWSSVFSGSLCGTFLVHGLLWFIPGVEVTSGDGWPQDEYHGHQWWETVSSVQMIIVRSEQQHPASDCLLFVSIIVPVCVGMMCEIMMTNLLLDSSSQAGTQFTQQSWSMCPNKLIKQCWARPVLWVIVCR